MNSDCFQSHTISLILSWVFPIPITIILVAYFFIFLAKTKEHFYPLAFSIWIMICVILFSPFKYIVFQTILAESYAVQSFYAFFTSWVLAFYLPFVLGVLYGIGLVLPIFGIAAIAGYYATSKTRLLLAAVAAPFLLFIGKTLFFLILPYVAFSVHWLSTEDVIKATNGLTEYYYRYGEHWETQRSLKQHIPDVLLKKLTPKELLRLHVASVYLSKKQQDYYISKEYPELYTHLNVISKEDETWQE